MMDSFAANLMSLIAFAGGLVALTVFATTKIVDLADGPTNKELSKTAKYVLSLLATALCIASVGVLGGDKVFALVSLMFQVPDLGVAPEVPADITWFQWVVVGVLDWLVAGGIWDWRAAQKKSK